ncbi:hypothetical protein O3M35_005137 [Rhynocoris fuscipes]|uniref:carbonic anhydrase n=1 Tax=Rhynocoris fuscipes TaxID=488301 RepID=A0AAW1DHL0_9HEMI
MEETMQSPIDLDLKAANGADLGPFTIENLFDKCYSTIINTSDAFSIAVPQECYISGGPLQARYKYEGMQFVWGGSDTEGSEHTINGQRFALEAQFIFKNSYKFKAPEELLSLCKTLTDLKHKIDNPEEEEEEEEDDDDEDEEEEEDEDEDEMKERYALLSKQFEETQKNRMEEWANKRTEMLVNERLSALGQNTEENKKINTKKMSAVEKKAMEDREIIKDIWREFRHSVEVESNLHLDEDKWVDLFKKYEHSKEAMDYVKKFRKERALAVVKSPAAPKVNKPEEEINSGKALKLEMDCYSRQEWAVLEQAKPKYAEWINAEIKVDKRLKREMRTDFELYLEELEERDELEDDDELTDDQKRIQRIKWQIEDEKKEAQLKDKLRQVIARRKKELEELSSSEIHGTTIVALMFKADPNTAPYEMFQYLTHITEPYKEITVDGNLLMPLKNSLTNGEYFTYTGSLTTPPYTENVNWIVIRDPMPILPQQVATLRTLKSEYGLLSNGNSRYTQSVGSRQVFFNKTVGNIVEPPCPGKETCPCKAAQPQKHWTDFI